ncbi:phosphomannomutase/phosphoglucomutase [Thermodesulfobacteriota bacterium]
MRSEIKRAVADNSYDYFEETLITENGFREYDVRWLLGHEINPNGFILLGRAYGTYLREVVKEEKCVVGHDFRFYSQNLKNALVIGLLSAGIDVVDVGMALTPMVYFAQHLYGIRGGAMVTASHNENGWTGIKIAKGLSSTLGPDEIVHFKKIVESGEFAEGQGHYEMHDDLFGHYMDDLVKDGKLGRKLKVVLAAGNGTAGRFCPPILEALGCEVVPVDCTPDWNFSRHNPNPEDLSFLEGIRDAALEHGADVGLGIDGDGDRLGVVDDQGREIFSDKLGLIVTRWMAPANPGRKVVIDVKSTSLYELDPILAEHGYETVMWKTGHSYIKAKVSEIDAIAGFEKSGHWFFSKPFGRGYDDGCVSMVHLCRMLDDLGVPLSRLVDDLPRTWQSPTIGPHCDDDKKYGVVDWVTKKYEEDMSAGRAIAGQKITGIRTVNGVRFNLEDGTWGLVRASSNKPSLVLVVESPTSEDALYDVMEHIQNRLAETGKVGDYDQQLPERGK